MALKDRFGKDRTRFRKEEVSDLAIREALGLGSEERLFICELSEADKRELQDIGIEKPADLSMKTGQPTGGAKINWAAFSKRPVWLLARTLCEASGELVFADPTQGEALLSGMPHRIIDPLYDLARKFNGVDLVKGEQEKNVTGQGETLTG